MKDLTEILAAVEALSFREKEQLFFSLAKQLRAKRRSNLPVRSFAPEQINSWIAEDEEDMRRIRNAL